MYGAQTVVYHGIRDFLFENDVEMYGAQTAVMTADRMRGLRMM